jgi:NAD(P)H-hydrate repair Nnr-like enzyme with NAD(P)H-hydrate dehydratase domain
MSWQKQTSDQPLFPDMLWDRPERRDQAGKLLIIGGNLHSFAAPAQAFAAATGAGIGVARVIIPDALKKTLRTILPEAIYAPSTPSGSFAKASLSDWADEASWADGVLLAGDFGHNSETAQALESFLDKYTGFVTITQDALEYFLTRPGKLINRPHTTLVLSIGQLQKLARGIGTTTAVTQAMGLPELAAWLEDFSGKNPITIITKHLNHLIVAHAGNVSSTPTEPDREPWRIDTAARAAVWQLQTPDKPYHAATSAVLDK